MLIGAIRNITGNMGGTLFFAGLKIGNNAELIQQGHGSFAGLGPFKYWFSSLGSGNYGFNHGSLSFNANNDVENSNPMAGHANGTEIRPYSIKMLPLISY